MYIYPFILFMFQLFVYNITIYLKSNLSDIRYNLILRNNDNYKCIHSDSSDWLWFLSLAWAIAQLGWLVGLVVIEAFSAITWLCPSLLLTIAGPVAKGMTLIWMLSKQILV